jgi:hypothetical protein
MRRYLPVVVIAWALALPANTYAGSATARTELKGTTDVTILNTSSTDSAQLVFTIKGAPTLEVSASGPGAASASLIYTINRTDVPQQLYNANLSVSAPPNGIVSPPIVPVPYTFDLAPNASITMQSVSDVIATATDSGLARIGLHSVLTYFNNSSVPLSLISNGESDSQYSLSLSGIGPPLTGLSALQGPFMDELTSNGSKTVPLAFSTTIPIDAHQTLTIGGNPLFLVAQVVPEPASVILLGISFAGLIVCCSTRRKLAGA